MYKVSNNCNIQVTLHFTSGCLENVLHDVPSAPSYKSVSHVSAFSNVLVEIFFCSFSVVKNLIAANCQIQDPFTELLRINSTRTTQQN